ncbi:MAG: hypothetical protein LBU85_08785 [Treponema sp.]|jgi:hypothetical protein|nr:hypothetical protein [Treponema sp.]
MLQTAADIAKVRNVSRQAVNNYILKNSIKPSGMKGKYPTYDCTKNPLAAYLSAGRPRQQGQSEPETPVFLQSPAPPEQLEKDSPFSPSKAETSRRISKPLNDLLAGRIGESGKLSAAFYDEALRMARESRDATLIFKLAVAADREEKDEIIREQMRLTEQGKEKIALERAERLKIENDIRKGMYLEREKVKLIFGRVFAVHTSILRPLSLKLSSMIAAVPEGDKKEATIKRIIDDEIFTAMGSIQRLLIEFIDE